MKYLAQMLRKYSVCKEEQMETAWAASTKQLICGDAESPTHIDLILMSYPDIKSPENPFNLFVFLLLGNKNVIGEGSPAPDSFC